MFVQVIEGKTSNPERLRAQLDTWIADLRPGATGYLGTTGGIAPDGRVIMFARFESEAAARANSDRPEQGEWWEATAGCFDGDVSFVESSDIESFLAGGSDDAGFVQVMKTPDIDRAKSAELDAKFTPLAKKYRPDLIGGIRVWTGRTCIEANYFTSEAEARAAESQDPPAEVAELLGEFMEMMKDVEFIDLPNPILNSA